MGSIVQRHHVPFPFPRFEDIQRGVLHGHPLPVLGEGHAHNVAGEQAADGPVADHYHVSVLIFLRHLGQKRRDAINQLDACFALGGRQAGRVRVPGSVDRREWCA